jgi:ATP-dependent protease Clp ATPase subunit
MTALRRLKSLKCSFCGKSEKDVSRLLSGSAGGHICDACVGVCNKILETVPQDFAGWSSMSDERLLEALRPAEAAVDGMRSVLQTQVDELRKRGLSWEAIGSALGVSRQAAWERFS